MSIGERLLLLLSRSPEDTAGKEQNNKPEGGHNAALEILNRVFPEFSSIVSRKRVVDFGCGVGDQGLALVEEFDCFVLGIDTNTKTLGRAVENAKQRSISQEKVEFVERAEDKHRGAFDVVISQNSFEHFPDPGFILDEMKSLLNENGVILLTFGPPWFAPYGSHMQFFCRVPWLNLLFSEEAVMSARSRYRSDGAKRYEDVESGLNRMTIQKFETLIAACGLEVVNERYECVKGLQFLRSIPVLRELFINHVSVVLCLPR